MNQHPKERLYHLLPTIYRQLDQDRGEPLRALLAGIESEFRTVEEDIAALYDNWFIETCDAWVVPYIAELLGVPGNISGTLFSSQRRQVANTLAYRRRKGIAAILEHVLQDATGWPVIALSYAPLLAVTQHLRDVRLAHGLVVNLRKAGELDTLDGPFETSAHTVDVRHIGSSAAREPTHTAQGKYQANTLGLFLWRLRSYQLTGVSPAEVRRDAVTGHFVPRGGYTFDSLGRDMPLFHLPQDIESLGQRTGSLNVPEAIRPITFASDLAAYRLLQQAAGGQQVEEGSAWQQSDYYGPDRSLCVMLNGEAIPPDAVISADLSRWALPPEGSYPAREHVAAIDVRLGRLRLLGTTAAAASDRVEVNYCYGFSADMGGGSYLRYLALDAPGTTHINVLRGGSIDTLQKALERWNALRAAWETAMSQHADQADSMGTLRCIIHIVDNTLYEIDGGGLAITLPRHSELVIEATEGMRPIVRGRVSITSPHASASLVLSGVRLDGAIEINGSLSLDIAHCTLMPHGLIMRQNVASDAPMRISINHSITGPLRLHDSRGEVVVRDSIIDGAPGSAIDAPAPQGGAAGPGMCLERVTVFGKVLTYRLHAQDALFTGSVVAEDHREGQISYSYVPEPSSTPPRVHCLPEDADDTRVYPLFTSTRYGDPAYAQLDIHCSQHIQRGASNGAEMGAFNTLRQAERRDNISRTLDEYLPFGLAAGVFFVT
jgi:hypothetical protein